MCDEVEEVVCQNCCVVHDVITLDVVSLIGSNVKFICPECDSESCVKSTVKRM